MNEEWKAIPGEFGFYEVSNLGRVRSLDREFDRKNGWKYTYKGRVLSDSPDGSGYVRYSLFKGKKRKGHHLVMESFGPPKPSESYEIHHKDHDRTNNCIDNLEWVTHAENFYKALRAGVVGKRVKLNPFMVRWIRRIAHKHLSPKEIANRLGMDKTSIYSVISRRSWSHVK